MKRLILTAAVLWAAVLCGWNHDKEAKAGSIGTRGVWLSVFEFEKIGLKDQPESQFRANADRIFANIRANGCNTVYFHVRAFDDAVYPSSTEKWSKYISGSGAALPYDPLKILVSSAHKYGLKFHAWMNPYRVTFKKVLDPGLASTTDRIVRQVNEIITRYPVDGIHFDDYFYPTNEKKYNKVSKAERMKNVNAMVQRVYRAVKAKNSKLKFGISPAGNIEYCEKIGADVKTWLSKGGYVDYLVPQIYWSDRYLISGRRTAMFTDRLAEWREINVRDVPMYIGLALYKAGVSLKEDPGWRTSAQNIANQIKMIRNGNSEGYVLFSYTDLLRPGATKEIKNYLKAVAKITLSKKKKVIKKGKKYRLKATVWPSRAQGYVKWKSSNKKIATVSKTGVVKAKKKGKVKIYAYFGTVKKACTVRVKKAAKTR